MSDQALILAAHGSRLQRSNQEVADLAALLAASLPEFRQVRAAFLELAEPDIGSAIDAAWAEGCKAITVFPYFLAAGRHVVEDIPAIVADRQQRYPAAQIRLLPYLGLAPGLPALIRQLLGQ